MHVGQRPRPIPAPSSEFAINFYWRLENRKRARNENKLIGKSHEGNEKKDGALEAIVNVRVDDKNVFWCLSNLEFIARRDI